MAILHFFQQSAQVNKYAYAKPSTISIVFHGYSYELINRKPLYSLINDVVVLMGYEDTFESLYATQEEADKHMLDATKNVK